MKYAEFQKTEFHEWFGINEIKRTQDANKLTRIDLKPGGHQEFIDLQVETADTNGMDSATLLIDRSWLIGAAGINVLGLDIAKSFINTLLPDSGSHIRDPLVQAIWDLSNKAKTLQTFQQNASVLEPEILDNLSALVPGISMTMITNVQNTTIPHLNKGIITVLLVCLGINDLIAYSERLWSLIISNEVVDGKRRFKIWVTFK
jgi:hypothetical protein